MRRLKIAGTGKYLPSRIVPGEEVDAKLGLSPGSSERMSGVRQRRYVAEGETNSSMGALALMAALESAHLKFEDLDAVICGSGSIQQAIPCTASLIQAQLGKGDSGIPCFDVNSTCLSFVTALDLAASLLESGRFRRIAVVSSEIASCGLNPEQHEAYSLFGDGAAAAVVELPAQSESSRVLFARMETFASAKDYCRIEGGGTLLHPGKHYTPENATRFLFHMEGRKVFRSVLEHAPGFVERALQGTGLGLEDFQLIIPHQASASGMELVRRKLGIDPARWMDILADHGNMIAASIPLALHQAVEGGRIRRGDRVMLFGTSAGLSLGIVALEF